MPRSRIALPLPKQTRATNSILRTPDSTKGKMFDTAIPQLYLVAMGGDKFTQDFEDEQIRMGDFGT